METDKQIIERILDQSLIKHGYSRDVANSVIAGDETDVMAVGDMFRALVLEDGLMVEVAATVYDAAMRIVEGGKA